MQFLTLPEDFSLFFLLCLSHLHSEQMSLPLTSEITEPIRQEPSHLPTTLHRAHVLCLPYSYSEWRFCAPIRTNPSTDSLHPSFLRHQFLPLYWIIPTFWKSHATISHVLKKVLTKISLILHFPPATSPFSDSLHIKTLFPHQLQSLLQSAWVELVPPPVDLETPGCRNQGPFGGLTLLLTSPPWCTSPGAQAVSVFPVIVPLPFPRAQFWDPFFSVSNCSVVSRDLQHLLEHSRCSMKTSEVK